MTKSNIKKIHCNSCKQETNHILVATHDNDYYEEDENRHLQWYEKTRYGFWICNGCDTAVLEDRYTNAGMDNHQGQNIYSYSYCPLRNNQSERVAKKFVHIDEKLNLTYLEVIKAHNQGLKIISAIGVRALLEGICVQEGIDDKVAFNLTKKIQKLQTGSNIPESIIKGLSSLKFIGDDAAHRLKATCDHTILISIELLEALLTHLYEAKFDLELKAQEVTKNHKG